MDFPRRSPGTKEPLPKIKNQKFMDWIPSKSLSRETFILTAMRIVLLFAALRFDDNKIPTVDGGECVQPDTQDISASQVSLQKRTRKKLNQYNRVLCSIGVVASQDDSANISAVLDDVLVNYNKKIRPGFGGGPTEILTDIYLRSMGPVSEKDMVYTLDFYFRQRWMDERLATNATLENISVSINMLDMIWFPDTIFYNGRKSHLHVVPTPNRFIRIGRNGSIYFSQRLTVRAICTMRLQNYPLDFQVCPLHFGSFAYSSSDVLYRWRYGDSSSVDLAPNLQMSQFDLINFSASHSTILRKATFHSMLSVQFGLKRHTGYFLINIFVPCILLVILSWVSFWINREATSDRIALGTTTVLTMTFLALDSRSDLPRVSYATALDLYVAMCFLFVLATILEFAVVHHFTKIRHGDAIHIHVPVPTTEKENDMSARAEYIRQRRLQRLKQLNNGTNEASPNNRTFLTRSTSSRLRVWCSSLKYKIKTSHRRKEPETNSVSMLDKTCRVLFPTVFAILNLAYWIMYST